MDISLIEMARRLREHSQLRIIYHIRPDGDCIGSAFALCIALQSIGKKCQVVGHDPIPRIHRCMTDKVHQDELTEPVCIAVDSASRHRIGSYGDQEIMFCIDHHANTLDDAEYRYVEQDCGACCEIILKLIKALEIPVTKPIADFLYLGLVTDTMSFRTSDTRVQTFETAAELARLGADVYGLGRRYMFVKSRGRLQVESALRDSFHFTCGDRILTGVIMLSDLAAAGIEDSDLEGINSMVSQVEGVLIGVTIREIPDHRMRCSMRTDDDISANEICAIHGGGGHFHAACCELDTDAPTARAIMEETCRKYLEERK